MREFRERLARLLAPGISFPSDHERAARLLRAAAEDSKMVLSAYTGPRPTENKPMLNMQVLTNIDNALAHADVAGIQRAGTIEGDAPRA